MRPLEIGRFGEPASRGVAAALLQNKPRLKFVICASPCYTYCSALQHVLIGTGVRTKRILLLIEPTTSYGRGILRGVASYARTRAHWRIQFDPNVTPEAIFNWGDARALKQIDGLIVRLLSPELLKRVKRLKIPIVQVGSEQFTKNLPHVGIDNPVVGRIVAEHLLDRGYQRFAVCGIKGRRFSDDRLEGFRARVAEAGYETADFDPPVDTWSVVNPADRAGEMDSFVRSFEPNTAVFCCNDEMGRHLIQACREADQDVPGHTAVVSVDNDEVLCELSDPPLSSVELSTDRIGFQAGRMLSGLIAGRQPKKTGRLLKPSHIVLRQSSDHVAIEDPIVRQAIQFIQDHADRGIDVGDILDVVSVSRRWLEVRFHRAMGRSPAQHIRKVQVERIKGLLAHTDLMMPEVADAVGLSDPKVLIAVFRREVGMTPTKYRRQYRLG